MHRIPLLLLTLAVGLGAAQAQTVVPKLDQQGRKGDVARGVKEKTAAKFDTADENKDGKLSRDEVAKHFRYLAENFDQRDADKDGFFSWEEFVGHDRWAK